MEAEAVQHAMLDLMIVLGEDIIAYEARASELVKAAAALPDPTGSIRDAARGQRVKALELRGQLAALRQEYVTRFGSEP